MARMDRRAHVAVETDRADRRADVRRPLGGAVLRLAQAPQAGDPAPVLVHEPGRQRDDAELLRVLAQAGRGGHRAEPVPRLHRRSEEHTSELQSLMRITYAVFCW